MEWGCCLFFVCDGGRGFCKSFMGGDFACLGYSGMGKFCFYFYSLVEVGSVLVRLGMSLASSLLLGLYFSKRGELGKAVDHYRLAQVQDSLVGVL